MSNDWEMTKKTIESGCPGNIQVKYVAMDMYSGNIFDKTDSELKFSLGYIQGMNLVGLKLGSTRLKLVSQIETPERSTSLVG